MDDLETTNNASGHKQIPAWKNASFWHITVLMAVFSIFYYMDVIINWAGWINLRWGIFYTVHDLHRALFLIPAMYATYKFRLKGIIVTSFISLLVFLPRALAVSPYPNPLLRALIFTISMVIMGVLLSLLLNNITKRRELEQSLWQAQNDLLRKRADSQRDEALDAMRENSDLFAKISCQVPGMLYRFARKPDGTYAVPFSSDGVREIFGCSPEDVHETFDPIFKAIYPEDRDILLQTVEESAGNLSPWMCEYRVQIPGKPIRWMLGNSIPEKKVDGTIVWSGYNTDVTERKRAEEEVLRLNAELEQKVAERTEELRNSQTALLNLVNDLNQSAKNTDLASQKLEETNKELGAFSYSVSHDLRAPLRSIDGFSLALLEDYEKKLDDTGKKYLHKIRTATQHMGVLIEDMLKLSRISNAEFHRESIDLSKIVQSISETFQQNNPGYNMKMVIQKGLVIKGDLNSMEIAMTNLLENAWKFTGKQKHPSIEFGMTATDGKKIFFVRDNGAGFDMAYTGKLFGAFQRLHSTDEFPGTGIGLATVKRIITRHGGQIWAEGEVGKGATFFFTLPE